MKNWHRTALPPTASVHCVASRLRDSRTGRRSLRTYTFLLLCVSFCLAAQGAEDGDAADVSTISYARQIEPIFRSHCQGCHQPAKAQGDFEMTSFANLLKAGESGEIAIVPGDPEKSYLLHQIEPVHGEAAMPKKGSPLHQQEIELIRQWIEQGARDDSPPSSPKFDEAHPPAYSRPPVVTAIAFSPDGKWIASSGFQEVLLINATTMKTERRFIGLSERIESLSFSPDSHRLAVTGGSPGRLGEVQVWDVDSGELQLSHLVTYDTVYGGCFSPDGKLIAFGCTDNTVRAIDSETGEQKLHQGAHEDWVRACVFNPDGKHLVSAGRDMTVKLTEVETERFVDNITSITPGALRGGISSLAMHPQRDEILVGGADGIPKVYRIFRETERRIGDDANLIRQFPSTKARIFDVAISRDGKRFAVASTLDGHSQITVYPYDFTGELSDEVKAAMKKRVADRNDEEKKLVSDYNSSTSDAILELPLDSTSLYTLAFSPDGQQIVCGGGDGLVRAIDITSGTVAHAFSPVELSENNQHSGSGVENWVAGHGMTIDSISLPNRSDEESILPKSKLIEIDVQPTEIELASPSDYAQLVVTARYAGGETSDVTRLCRFDVGSDALQVSEFGLVRGIGSGKAELKVTFGSETKTLPAQVGDLSAAQHPDFVRDVNPILSRLGCNSGTCHGAQKGKNGFKLSLRGYDPVEDIRALGDDLRSRRLNTAAADASLMLLKPLGSVPHEGGVLLTKNSVHYQTLRNWIADGAIFEPGSKKVARIEVTPQKPVIERENAWQQFRIVAYFPDGSARDVTHEAFIESGNGEVCKSHPGGRVQALRRGEAPILARYEGAYAAATVTVMGDREGFAWQEPDAFSTVDQLVAAKWQRMKIVPSELCEDHEFLRRVRLDLTGLPPTSEELKAFLADKTPSKIKRQKKIDELIGSKDYVDHWANKWADLLQVNSKFIGTEGAKAFRDWIRASVEENRPYDEFARDILTATGSNKEHPAASYFKILREPDLMMENTTHLFLAVRFNCNKCHDHPFERWTQQQYYEMAAFFAQTELKKDPASGDKKIGGTAVEGAKPLYEIVSDNSHGEMKHVSTGANVPPAFPFDCDYEAPENATRRQQMAAWLTSKDNPYFAKSFVNRMWGYLTGTGLTEPIDDIRAGNPPTNPELLDHLTQEFVDSGFDVQHVVRLICSSRTYQLSVASNDWNVDDKINYSHAKARRLPAEVLYDAVYQVTGAVSTIPGVAPGTRAASLPDVAVQLDDGFLNNLGRPVRESACECERSQELQLGPVMALVSGPTVGKAISDPQCALPRLAKTELSEEEMVREIYLRVLSREASDEEVTAILQSADQIATDHEQLASQLAEREAWWLEEKAALESKRLADLAATKQAIVDRELAIAPEREKMEAERVQKLAAAEQALTEYAATKKELADKYLTDQNQMHWFPLAPIELNASNKDALMPQSDRSIVASGKAGKGYYDVTFETPLTNITGFRLEALPQPGIAGGGPGLPKNGNFVVTEIDVDVSSTAKPDEIQRAVISEGVADFTQDGFDPKQVFDGRNNDQKGWAVSPRGGVVHWAAFKFAEPIGQEGTTRIKFRIYQNHNAEQHRLAHFRISVTTDQGDLLLGLPEDFVAVKQTKPEHRSDEALTGLLAYLEQTDDQWQKLKMAVAAAKKPLPDDAELVGLRSQQKLLEIETPDDAKLVQLRRDMESSTQQVSNRRLTLAQDLTWALINSPAFLFNH